MQRTTSRRVIIFASLIGAAALVYFLFFRKKAAAGTTDSTGKTTTGDPSPILGGPAALQNLTFPITKGQKGLQVLYVQGFLNMFKGAALKLDGDFGPLTQAAWKIASGGDDFICGTGYDLLIYPQAPLIKQYLKQQGALPA